MDCLSEFDSASSDLAGTYRQNAFYINMSSLFDLDPSDGDPLPAAVAMHAHEYVHFLHNVSTTAGQAYLLANLVLLRVLANGCDEQGYFGGLEALTEEQQESLLYIGCLMRAQLGATDADQLAACTDICSWECNSSFKIDENNGLSTVAAIFSARDRGNELKSQSIEIGFSFITEGVAYEVEREMRRLGGTLEQDLDTHTKIFPYRSYHLLVRSWSGRELTTEELIAIGVCAMNHQFSGFWLATICLALRDNDLSLQVVLDKAYSSCQSDSQKVLDGLQEQRRDLSAGRVILTAMGEYIKLAEAGLEMRKKDRMPESLLLSRSLCAEDFKQTIGKMLDCLIIQQKPCDELDMFWHGPGLAAQSDEAAQCLGALQSALHFSQLHLIRDGSFAKTADIKPRYPVSCPFSGGCEAERADQYPETCKSAPWKRFMNASSDQNVCWYAAGVKGLGGAARVS